MKIKTRDMLLTALFSALMAVGAFIKILFPLIPFSFQPFFCAFSGIILGSRLGMLSQIIYVAVGLAGVPVFTQGGGPMYVLKPSFGFLIGFILGAYVTGKISEKLKTINFKSLMVSVMAGLAIINLIGVPYLYLILKFYLIKPDTTLMSALAIGFFPFILKDFTLYILVALVSSRTLPILRKAGLLTAYKST